MAWTAAHALCTGHAQAVLCAKRALGQTLPHLQELEDEEEALLLSAAGAEDSAAEDSTDIEELLSEAEDVEVVSAVDCVLAQAVSISAATSAPRASLVFIDRYPEEKQEWYGKQRERVFSRSASPSPVARPNSIDSESAWKLLRHSHLSYRGHGRIPRRLGTWPRASAPEGPRSPRIRRFRYNQDLSRHVRT